MSRTRTPTDYTAERIRQNDSALLIVDHQVGLFQLTRDWDPTVFRQNMIAHAAIAKVFNIPVVMTTSTESGPNGHLPKEILDMYPDVEVVQRKGEIKYVHAYSTCSAK
jgi:nicotinamidase-related amidase